LCSYGVQIAQVFNKKPVSLIKKDWFLSLEIMLFYALRLRDHNKPAGQRLIKKQN